MHPDDVPRFQTDLFVPQYRPMRQGNWEVRVSTMNLVPGYWSGTVLAENMAALLRGGATWMSMTPYEIESQETGVRRANGNVLVFGLGMGWAAMASALRGNVSSVTVVEQDADVIAIYRALDVESQLPHEAHSKIRVVQGDACNYRPDRAIDVLLADIWLPLVSDGRVEEVRRMQEMVRAKAVYFWGQEMELARHAMRGGRRLDREGIAATAAEWGLPLLGLELADYPERIALVARRWMRGRWFPGFEPGS